MLAWGSEARQVSRVNYQHGVEFETHARAWLDIADTGQHESCQHGLVGSPLPYFGANLFEQLVTRSLFNQLDQRFDLRPQTDGLGRQNGLTVGNRGQTVNAWLA